MGMPTKVPSSNQPGPLHVVSIILRSNGRQFYAQFTFTTLLRPPSVAAQDCGHMFTHPRCIEPLVQAHEPTPKASNSIAVDRARFRPCTPFPRLAHRCSIGRVLGSTLTVRQCGPRPPHGGSIGGILCSALGRCTLLVARAPCQSVLLASIGITSTSARGTV